MRRTPKEVQESSRAITRRGLLMGGAIAAYMGVLALRMRHMQVDQADEYRLLADGNSVKIRLIPPARGMIHDRNGHLLAGNEQNYRVTLTREDAGDVGDVLGRLRRLIPISEDDADGLMTEFGRRSPSAPITVADRLPWEDFSRIAVNIPALPGVSPEVGLSRLYPRRQDCAHILGYVGPVSDYDLERIEEPDPLLRLPQFQLGKIGLEARLEDQLRGRAGSRRVEVNASGREMRELSRIESEPGQNIQLTLDYPLQNYTQARLGTESAAAVVMDVQSGDIRAIVSSPSFDPNLFVRGISGRDYRALMDHDHRPLADKTVQGLYPPGSTYKMVTALAALEAGVIGAGDTVYCPGHYTLGGRRFHCWRRGGHGSVAMVQALEVSCDTYFYDISQRVGIDRMRDMALRLGLATRHDLPMSAVAEGIAPSRDWKLARHGESWQIGDTLNASIGQGFVLSSPLQLAVMTARIASGKAVVPRLVRAVDGVEVPVEPAADLGLAPGGLELMRRGMDAVVNSGRGTANGSRIALAEYRMAGKTGTSQVRNISAAERARGVTRNDQLPWNRRDHALFVAYAPVEAPRFAISLVVEHGGGGSSVAAPIARDIMLQALFDGTPPLEAYPSSQRGRIETQQQTLELFNPAAPAPGRSRA